MGASTTTYKRAGAYVTDPVLNETTGQFSANYTPGVSERRAGVSTFLHSGLKNADARTTDGSAITADRQYDAFGNLTGGNGAWNGPFGYAGAFGYQEDGESGLKLLGHRYYDSTTGRFLSKDPIGDGRNWYSYCDNNPVKLFDAGGLKPKLVVILGDMSGGLSAVGLVTGLKERYGDRYEIVIRHARDTEEAVRFLTYADAAVLIGHGSPFATRNGILSEEDIYEVRRRRHRLGKKQLDFLASYSCTDCAEPARRKAYLSIADALFGYDDLVSPGSPSFFGDPTGPDIKGRRGEWWRRKRSTPLPRGAGVPVRYP